MARRKAKERADELRGLSDEDLAKELEEASRRLFTVRLQLSTRQQTNTAERTKAKRQIARIRTLQRERELTAAYAPASGEQQSPAAGGRGR
jgi:large subunit ribosomal protein L29